ncbi:MAG: alpha/beta hydrolase [Rubrivivax sp. SCN 71-131]|nr:MAG: alpha/beta hydrolase [Rubrivivax sp. SCN 71-131]
MRRLVGLLLIFGAILAGLSRAPDRPVQSLVARWAQAPSDFVDIRGQIVHLRDQGPRADPLPIVLLHGTSSSLHTWEGWARELHKQRRVISFDLPGAGLTGPFDGQYARDDYRGDTYARFVLDLLDGLKLPRVVLAGNSLGGEIAWRVATLAPERVAQLVLVDAAGPPFKPESVPLGFIAARLPVFSWLSRYLLPRELVAQSVADVYGDARRVTPALVDRYFELTLREGNRRALGLRLQQMAMGEDAERIAQVRQPTLILWGARDRLIPPATGQDFARRIPGSQLVVLPGVGHMPQEEDPQRSLEAVKAFIGWR